MAEVSQGQVWGRLWFGRMNVINVAFGSGVMTVEAAR